MVCIIDYGAGNPGSIANMIRKLGGESIISANINDISTADKLILPGVGHFDHGMSKLNESKLTPILSERVNDAKVPILGICLGAQLMTKSSEEGNIAGLGWFNAQVKKFSFDNDSQLRIPHMGWDYVKINKKTPITEGLAEDSRYYFVHSYFMESNNEEEVLFSTLYGHEFVSGLNKDNIYAVQFHPEKSHKFGLKLFDNFLRL